MIAVRTWTGETGSRDYNRIFVWRSGHRESGTNHPIRGIPYLFSLCLSLLRFRVGAIILIDQDRRVAPELHVLGPF